MSAKLPAPLSITHQHLLAVLLSEFPLPPVDRPLRLLDAGCGDGLLLDYLAACLRKLWPQTGLELYGYDVSNHGVQPAGYFDKTLAMLQSSHPDLSWTDRLQLIRDTDPWPWPAEYFDIVVSNQVLEHVRDHLAFFGELQRCLRPGGVSAHLFPLRHVLVEPHLQVPLAHRVRNRGRAAVWIELMTRLGWGRWDRGAESRRRYAEKSADYLAENVNYQGAGELRAKAQACGLEAGFRYTRDFYFAKLRALGGRPARLAYQHRNACGDALWLALLKRVASVTFVLRKPETRGVK